MSITLALLLDATTKLIKASGETPVESIVANGVQWLRLAVEFAGAVTIGIGITVAAYQFVKALIPGRITGFNEIRLTLARFPALALEFQLGADILSTAIAPSWDEIGKLGAIAVIRTGLNFFLSIEMREERGGITPDEPVLDKE
jgi:uncharacterized membrane protein